MTGGGRRGGPLAQGPSDQLPQGGLFEEARGASLRPTRGAPKPTQRRRSAASPSKGRTLLAVAAALLLIMTGCTESGAADAILVGIQRTRLPIAAVR